MKLQVLQFDTLVGCLESTADRGVIFLYAPDYLAAPNAKPLSVSLPLRESPYFQASAMPFFSGLLPDGEARRRIADYLHISETSAMKLLDALGGECAGTVRIERLAQEDAPDDGTMHTGVDSMESGYQAVSDDELARLILDAERHPLMIPRGGARLSLAGAQEKLPLFKKEGRWYRPVGGTPSSHIIKPASTRFPEIVWNEFICMHLAAALDFKTPSVEFAVIGKPVLIVERYDRVFAPDGGLSRIHQEDFCQALGIMPDKKYQADGGPGFQDVARLVRRTCSAPLRDIERLIDIGLFNVLVGNCDAHGKNFSLLYRDQGVELAPFYDLVSTTYWPQLDTKLSMRFGTDYRLEKIDRDSLAAFAADLGVKPGLVKDRLDELIRRSRSAWEDVYALPESAEAFAVLEKLRRGWESRAETLNTPPPRTCPPR